MAYKLLYPLPLISPELVKSHLALISLLAYKAAVDSELDGTKLGLSLKQGCLFLLKAPVNPSVVHKTLLRVLLPCPRGVKNQIKNALLLKIFSFSALASRIHLLFVQ